MHAGLAHARRADEIHFRYHDPAAVLLAEKDHARHQKVQIGRTKAAGPAHIAVRVLAGADQVDVGLSVDLAAAEKERLDAALCRHVEQLDAAAGEAFVAQ